MNQRRQLHVADRSATSNKLFELCLRSRQTVQGTGIIRVSAITLHFVLNDYTTVLDIFIVICL